MPETQPKPLNKNRKISVTGLGYVGLPVALAFGKREKVIGYDRDEKRVLRLSQGFDDTQEVSPEELTHSKIHYTTHPEELSQADFHIVAVPTPVREGGEPDLEALMSASDILGRYLKKDDIVVYESTVYPGLTEEVCVPILEKKSGLRYKTDFKVGYSPERINPGDRQHSLTRVKKIVSGCDPETLEIVAEVYGSIVDVGVHRASSIAIAEAAKVIENVQRDLNIALINEIALICHRMNIDTQEVLDAASTKWNFISFRPGLVGGHCIGVDPYYLTHKAEQLGYHPEVILSGRRINDGMGAYLATELVKLMGNRGLAISGARVSVLGVTFKEDITDIRNSKVIDIIRELQKFGIEVQVADPYADAGHVFKEYGFNLVPIEKMKSSQAVVFAVSHRVYREAGWNLISSLLEDKKGVVMDIKSTLDRKLRPESILLWRL